MKNAWKKISVSAIAVAMLLTMAACGGTASESAPAASASSESSSTAATVALTEDEYKAELTRLATEIGEKSASMTSIDTTDATAAAAAAEKMIADVSPLYNELAALVAPEKFAADHATIADGANASAELLELSKQLFDIAAGKAEGDVAKLTAEVQAKTAELTPKATAMMEAVQKILAS